MPVGPLTNIALAVEKDPTIVPLVKEVILMGGSITGGNVNAAAEANIYNDPEAAQIVFQAGWPLTMVGLDVGDKTLFSAKYLAQLGQTHGPVNDFIYQVTHYLIDLSSKFGFDGSPMYDPLAVGVAVDATLVKAPPCTWRLKPAASLRVERRSPIVMAPSNATCCTVIAT